MCIGKTKNRSAVNMDMANQLKKNTSVKFEIKIIILQACVCMLVCVCACVCVCVCMLCVCDLQA